MSVRPTVVRLTAPGPLDVPLAEAAPSRSRPALLGERYRIPAYVAVLWVGVAVCLAFALPIDAHVRWLDLVVFVAVGSLAECWFVNTSRDTGMSLSFTVHFAALVLFGPAFGAVVALVGIAVGDGLVKRRPLVRTLFNMAQMAIAVAAAGVVYQALRTDLHHLDLVSNAGALAVSAAVYMIVNDTLVSAVIALSGGSFVQEWIGSFRDLMLPYVSMAPLGTLVAFTYQSSPINVAYFLPLTLVIYNGFKLFVSLQRETDHALVALADSIDKRDRYTYQHSQRVAFLAGRIATSMGMPSRDVDLIVAAARVHDLGKIAVDNRVLLKPSKLTDDERKLIEAHPAEGGELAGKFKMFRQGLGFIRHHHERWDGRGYPDGLAGQDIPLGARVITVADCFDAMTSDRPYRGALPAAVAIEELERCSGSQFDRDVVRAFVALAEREPSIARFGDDQQSEVQCLSC